MGQTGSKPLRELTAGDVRGGLEALSGRLPTRYLHAASASGMTFTPVAGIAAALPGTAIALAAPGISGIGSVRTMDLRGVLALVKLGHPDPACTGTARLAGRALHRLMPDFSPNGPWPRPPDLSCLPMTACSGGGARGAQAYTIRVVTILIRRAHP
jgi:hypothetical protein